MPCLYYQGENTMGFTVKRKIYKLIFEDDDLAGLEILARSVSLGQMLAISGEGRVGKVDTEDAEQTQGMFEMFAGALVQWNLEEEDGTPIPVTMEGLQGLDTEFVTAIIEAWTSAIAGVTAPLAKQSTSGGTSQEASIPMETLSLPPES
jgi:hypothetical protein